MAATPHPWHTAVTVTADGWGNSEKVWGKRMQNGCRMDAEWMQNGTEFSGAKEENMFVNML